MRTLYTLGIAALLGGTLAGCGEQVNMLPELHVAPAPANGLQMILPIVQNIQPGSDNEICTWTDVFLDKDTDIESIQGFQTATGHHLVLFSTTIFQPGGTSRPCTDKDMSTFRFVAGAAGEGNQEKNDAPKGVSYFIPKGSQIVLNQHFLNATPQVKEAQSAINIYYADPSKPFTRSGAISIMNGVLNIPPGPSKEQVHCTLNEDYATWFFIPHMHEWGKHIKVTRTRSGAVETLFDVDWQPDYAFHPPEKRNTADAPLWFRKGDDIDITCEWQNNSKETLTFGREMCLVFGGTIDTEKRGNWLCDFGEWSRF